MSHLYPFLKGINLHVEGRISVEDAERQEATAKEILARLKNQPGVILADEVGMGKTFVALAVAISVAVADYKRRPVVVMVPPSLQDKWPIDFSLFVSKCMSRDLQSSIRYGKATRAEEFLKMLDDPVERRRSIIFVTHGAMSRGLSDKWVKLALIRQALFHRYGIDELKRNLCRILGHLLWSKWMDTHFGPELWEDLLRESPENWLSRLRKWHIDPEEDDDQTTDDDPVPRAVCDVLRSLNTDNLIEKLKNIPRRHSEHFDQRVHIARQEIQDALRSVWKECIQRLKLRLPLLILDEAHHLKNPDTQLASLFRCQDAKDDAHEVTRGALGEAFERMLFLTATPFQLGHDELCSVLDRFEGIAWNSRLAPRCGIDGFRDNIAALRKALDAAQESALRLDEAWGRLRPEHLYIDNDRVDDVEEWWQTIQQRADNFPEIERILHIHKSVYAKMREAEKLLRPWVIRHLKPRRLPAPNQHIPRRIRLPGRAILGDGKETESRGLDIEGEPLVPFLLAARATACSAQGRALFAEGLASSYEAFLHTREANKKQEGCLPVDSDDEGSIEAPSTEELSWYLEQLGVLVPTNDPELSASHPKIAATVRRVVETWKQGEKVLVFCHFIATGRALRTALSHAIRGEIAQIGADKLGCSLVDVFNELDKLGKRFFDEDSPIRRSCNAEVDKILQLFPELAEQHNALSEAVRRNVRTPSFLVRYFPLKGGRLREEDMLEALNKPDQSGMTLQKLIMGFFEFLNNRCDQKGRAAFIDAIGSIQTGFYVGRAPEEAYSDDELQGEDVKKLLPNIRLVNGTTSQVTRQRLMLAFNTPFFPEVVVASSVLAEGVDLQLNCRYVIHHDLCWNPSTLEQRTGRIDRVGAKAERCGLSIYVYLPYINETQDEKMYKVVMDRERWFSVVMGEKFELSELATEKLSRRIPLPESVAQNLAFRLEVHNP
jgi:hypothetical protein